MGGVFFVADVRNSPGLSGGPPDDPVASLAVLSYIGVRFIRERSPTTALNAGPPRGSGR
jgi:hypothetical protein